MENDNTPTVRDGELGTVYIPPFSHAHYHSYEVHDGKISRINPLFRTRAEDITTICNYIGAESVVDIGCNFGGFLFYLEKIGGRSKLWGVDGDHRYISEDRITADHLNSRVSFTAKGLMELELPSEKHDAIILQNVYHYIFDRVGDHLQIFRKLAGLGRSIIWYNPMSSNDPVIPLHAMSNDKTDWSNYTKKEIFKAAVQAGFLHPIPLRSRSAGMGETREHWLFVLDEQNKIEPEYYSLHEISGTEVAVKSHYSHIHRVFLNERQSFKIFLDRSFLQCENIMRAISLGIYDRHVCGDLAYLVSEGEVVGYIQPRGILVEEMSAIVGEAKVRELHRLAVWRLASRMLRYDVFNHDLDIHNFVGASEKFKLNAIDLEGILFDATSRRQLSIYQNFANEEEIKGARNNLEAIYTGYQFEFEGLTTGDILWRCMTDSDLVSSLNLTGLLKKSDF